MLVKSKDESHWCWDAECEALIGLFARALYRLRGYDQMEVMRDMNHRYLKLSKGEKGPSSFTPTQFQKDIIESTREPVAKELPLLTLFKLSKERFKQLSLFE